MQRNKVIRSRSTLTSYRRSLERKHSGLEYMIADEMRRPLPDTIALQSLKRSKLRVREELDSLDGVLRTVSRIGKAA